MSHRRKALILKTFLIFPSQRHSRHLMSVFLKRGSRLAVLSSSVSSWALMGTPARLEGVLDRDLSHCGLPSSSCQLAALSNVSSVTVSVCVGVCVCVSVQGDERAAFSFVFSVVFFLSSQEHIIVWNCVNTKLLPFILTTINLCSKIKMLFISKKMI